MGEAKRRRDLGLPPKGKKFKNRKIDESQDIWSKISLKKLKSQFPAAPFVTIALIFVILQWGFSLNS